MCVCVREREREKERESSHTATIKARGTISRPGVHADVL